MVQSLSEMVIAISATTAGIAWDAARCEKDSFLATAFFYIYCIEILTEASHRVQSKLLSTVEALYSGGATPYALIHTL